MKTGYIVAALVALALAWPAQGQETTIRVDRADLGARHAQTVVRPDLDVGLLERLREARPAGAGVTAASPSA